MPVRDDKNGDGWGGVSLVGGDDRNWSYPRSSGNVRRRSLKCGMGAHPRAFWAGFPQPGGSGVVETHLCLRTPNEE